MSSAEAAPRQNSMNYSFLDGLRGIGAFVVYLTHFRGHFFWMEHAKKSEIERDPEMIKAHKLPQFTRYFPFPILWHGYFWVAVFFILSGFVLTLRFFKIRKHTCITGGTFRRYLRLMMPVWIIMSLYYFVFRMELYKVEELSEDGFARIEDKTFMDLCYDSLINTWYGDNTWAIPIWTLSLELTATFMVYLIA